MNKKSMLRENWLKVGQKVEFKKKHYSQDITRKNLIV